MENIQLWIVNARFLLSSVKIFKTPQKLQKMRNKTIKKDAVQWNSTERSGCLIPRAKRAREIIIFKKSLQPQQDLLFSSEKLNLPRSSAFYELISRSEEVYLQILTDFYELPRIADIPCLRPPSWLRNRMDSWECHAERYFVTSTLEQVRGGTARHGRVGITAVPTLNSSYLK